VSSAPVEESTAAKILGGLSADLHEAIAVLRECSVNPPEELLRALRYLDGFRALPQPVLRVTADKKGLLIACGEQSVTLPPSALAATLADIAGGEGGGGSKPAEAVDRALKGTADASSSYDTDARAVARVLLRHYGDEAEAVVDRLPTFLDHARLERRKR